MFGLSARTCKLSCSALLLLECRVAGAGGAQAAKDAAGDVVKASSWLKSHKPSKHSMRLFLH